MKKIPDIMDFESFLLEKKTANTQREDTIADAVKKIKDEYGHNTTEFIASAQKKGVDAIKDFISKIVEPYIDRIQSQNELPLNGRFNLDYDGLLSGLVSWIIVELQLTKKDKSK